MRRNLVVAFAVLASLLVATAPAAAASTSTAVVRTNTTATDFQASSVHLTNMSVVGSGTAASVKANTSTRSVSLSGAGVTDGHSKSYDLNDFGAASDPNVTFTGSTATAWDNVTATGVGDGGTVAVDVAGNVEPHGPSSNGQPVVEITGHVGDLDVAYQDPNNNLKIIDTSGNVQDLGVQTLSIGGIRDLDGEGDLDVVYSNQNSYLKIVDASGNVQNLSVKAYTVGGIGDLDGEGDLDVAYTDPNNNLKIVDASGNVQDLGVQAYAAGGIGDLDGDGDLDVAYRDTNNNLEIVDASGNVQDLGVQAYNIGGIGDLDGEGDLDVAYQNSYLKIADASGNVQNLSVQSDSVGGIADVDGEGDLDVAYRDNSNNLEIVDASGNVQDLGVQTSTAGGIGDLDGDATSDPQLDIDGDGTYEISISGKLTSTVTREIASLNVTDDTTTVSTSSGTVDLTFKLKERTVTTDPSLEVNNDHWLNATQTLSAGESVTLTGNSAWLREGTNTINVSLPSVSADAPTMQVDYTYEHTTTNTFGGPVYRANASARNVTEATVDLATHNAEATIKLQEWTGSSWNTVASTTGITANGTHTVTTSPIAADLVRTRVAFAKTGSNPIGWVDSETVKYQNHNPTATSLSLNGTTTRQEDVTLSAQVDDPEFDDPQGDSVTAEIVLDGTTVKTVTGITSATTVSYSATDLSEGSHSWSVVVTDGDGLSQTTSASFTTDYAAPSVTQFDPADGGKVSSYDGNVTLTVNDSDFAAGDTVTVELKNDSGGVINTKSLASNGSLTFSYSAVAGQNTLYAALNDTRGFQKNVTYQFETPSTLYIRNVSDTSQLVTTSTQVEVKFFGDSDTVVTKTTTSGKVQLDGLDPNAGYVVKVSADGYYQRRAFINSLYEQQAIFLLNDSRTANTVEFAIDDQTGGSFPPTNVRLLVKRPLNTSNTQGTEYLTVVSGVFGSVNRIPTDLRQGVRYRLSVVNRQSGARRDLGKFISDRSQTVTLPIGEVSIESKPVDGQVRVALETANTSNGPVARVAISDPSNNTTNVEWMLVNASGQNNTTVTSATVSGPIENYRATVPINETEGRYFVNVSGTHDGQQFQSVRYGGGVQPFVRQLPIDPIWRSLIGYVGIIALTGFAVIVDSRLGAMTAAVTATLFTAIGFVAIPVPLLALAAGTALLFAVGGG